jgi:membrane protease YdiL (CAAX protease family)
MNDLRLNRKDGTFILVCLLVLAAGVLVSFRYFKKAFPEATIDFRYDRAGSGGIADRFADSLDWQIPKEYRHASRFGYDDFAKTYLEKELGVEGAQPYLGKPIRLWYWQHRWFKPSTKEEYRIFVTPEGEVVRVAHEIAEDAAGADLAEDTARVMAQHFLFVTMGQDSTKMTFIESQHVGRPHRGDWTFTWRATGIEPVKGAEYRYSIDITGNQFGGYKEWLKVPEEWQASYRKLRSLNDAASSIDGIGFVLTGLAILSIFYLRMRRKDLRWRIALKFGIVAAALILLNAINDFPQNLYWYQTEDSWSGFLTSRIFLSLLGAVAAGAAIFLLTAAAETMYRAQYPTKLALPKMFTARGLRTKSSFKNILLGVTMTSFFFAYQIAFYLIAAKNGAWSPSDVPYDNLLNTAMPWLAVIAVGFFPAVTEEFMSRMFSIPFLQRLFKNRMLWLALLLPAVIWGFGHAGYPNQPWWIRGAEVGIAGVIIGVVMLKWGILATLVWHYTVDALYTAFLLFRSHNPYLVLTAAVAVGIMVIPLLWAFLAYLRKGSFLPEQGALNADEGTVADEHVEAPAPEIKAVEAPTTTYHRLPSRGRWIGAGVLAAGIIAVLIPVEHIGDFISYPVNKSEAVRIFADTLRATGWANPDTLKIAAFANEDNDGIDAANGLVYLLKHSSSVHDFNWIADERLAVGRWRVYAWQPENRLRYSGSVHARTKQVGSVYPWLPEEMPGDSLSKDSAAAIVERSLTQLGEDTSTLVLKEYRDFARPKRLDHTFTYEAREGDPRHVAEAKFRRYGSVYGHYQSVNRYGWYKIPEEWTRERKALTTLRAIREGLTILAIAGAVVWMLVLLGMRARKGNVPWKRVLLAAIVPAVITLLAQLNLLYLSQAEYFQRVEISAAIFRTTLLTSWLSAGLVSYVMYALGFAFLCALYPERMPWLRSHERRAAAWDTWIGLGAGIGAYLLVRSVRAWVAAWQPGWIPFHGWNTPEWLAAPVPLLMMLENLLAEALLLSVLLAFAAHLWTGPWRVTWKRALLVLGAVLILLGGDLGDPGEWLFNAIYGVVAIALVWLLLRNLVEGRPMALFAVALGAMTVSAMVSGLGAGNASLTGQTWALIVLMLLVFALWLAPPWRGKRLPVD